MFKSGHLMCRWIVEVWVKYRINIDMAFLMCKRLSRRFGPVSNRPPSDGSKSPNPWTCSTVFRSMCDHKNAKSGLLLRYQFCCLAPRLILTTLMICFSHNDTPKTIRFSENSKDVQTCPLAFLMVSRVLIIFSITTLYLSFSIFLYFLGNRKPTFQYCTYLHNYWIWLINGFNCFAMLTLRLVCNPISLPEVKAAKPSSKITENDKIIRQLFMMSLSKQN